MPHEHSITRWMHDLQQGNSTATTALWETYFHKLVDLARRKLQGVRGGIADEEDVALSAFRSFCRAAEAGRFPDLADRDQLWHLLIELTVRKAVDLRRFEGRLKRGGGRVLSETDRELELSQIVGDTPTPEFAAVMAEEFELRLQQLDVDLRELALAKLEGWSNPEIAERMGFALRTVERRLHLIRRKWSDRGDTR